MYQNTICSNCGVLRISSIEAAGEPRRRAGCSTERSSAIHQSERRGEHDRQRARQQRVQPGDEERVAIAVAGSARERGGTGCRTRPGCSRKPKSTSMLRRASAPAALCAAQPSRSRTASAAAAWPAVAAQLRRAGGGGRRGAGPALASGPGSGAARAVPGDPRPGGRASGQSAERQRVVQAAVLVELVLAAREVERLGAEELVIQLAVVADRLDGPIAPGIVEAHHLAEPALDAEQALDHRVAARPSSRRRWPW